ncbi:hypothetical protein GCM10027447_03260 [Glycomyces halotolerans]
MSKHIVAHRAARSNSHAAAPPANVRPLVRGSFSDGVHRYTVRASSAETPDSFQVYANGDPADIVLVISGLISKELKATWGAVWNRGSDEWREWLEANAFMVFYNGDRPAIGKVRVCSG